MSIQEKIKQNIALAPFTTFKIGGPAKFFIEVPSFAPSDAKALAGKKAMEGKKTKEDAKQELIDIFEWAKKEKQAVFILGGGSNLLINDQGVDGLVIKMKNEEIKVQGERLNCGAGATLSKAVRLAASSNLTGLEWAGGIPGATLGGSVRGNAGAFGEEMGGAVETVEVFNVKKRRFLTFSRKDCWFEYRGSIFKKDDSLIIWNVILRLHKGKPRGINKKADNCQIRRSGSQPRLPSAGCVFKNINIKDLHEANNYMANLALEQGAVKGEKVGAGWLIDMAGLKGKTIGGAKISLEHANFIVNTGQATAEDVIMLISYIKQQIRTKFKVQLQEEVQYLGFN